MESGPSITGAVTEGADSLNAWVNWTNAHGGINGHPVKLFVLDDKGDPAVGLADVQTLVQTDHVIAIVGQEAQTTGESWAPYTLQQRIPVIGGYLGYPMYFTNPMWYPVGGDVTANIWGQMKSAAVQGVKKVGVILCTESPQCASAQPLFESAATAVGMTSVYNALASTTQVSYTAECLAAKNAGVQALAAFVNTTVLAADCARQNFNPKWINSDDGPTVATIQATPALGRTVGSSEVWNCAGPQTAATAAFYLAMQQYAPQWLVGGSKYPQSAAGADCASWASGEAFKLAIENAVVAPNVTASNEDVIRGLAMFKNTMVGPYSPPMTYSDGSKPNPIAKCVYLYRYQGTKLIPVPGPTQYTCQP